MTKEAKYAANESNEIEPGIVEFKKTISCMTHLNNLGNIRVHLICKNVFCFHFLFSLFITKMLPCLHFASNFQSFI